MYMMVSGDRAELRGLNLEGMRRLGFSELEVISSCNPLNCDHIVEQNGCSTFDVDFRSKVSDGRIRSCL